MKPKGAKTDPLIRKAKAKKVIKSLQNNNMDVSESAKDLEITPQGVRKHIRENPYVKNGLQSMLDALENAGATDEKHARVINEAMDAKTGEEADHGIRLKAAEQRAKLKRLIGEDDGRGQDKPQEQHVHLHFHEMTKEQVQQFIQGKLQK